MQSFRTYNNPFWEKSNPAERERKITPLIVDTLFPWQRMQPLGPTDCALCLLKNNNNFYLVSLPVSEAPIKQLQSYSFDYHKYKGPVSLKIPLASSKIALRCCT